MEGRPLVDVDALAREIRDAYANRRILAGLPSSREGGLDLVTACAVERELARERRSNGRVPVGRKVGFANKALWRMLGLDTVVWAHMYDDTVRHAGTEVGSLSVGHMVAPRIEPEIVFKLATSFDEIESTDAAAVLSGVEWLALGFEIIDCVYPDWKFQPADFVAAYGLHAALIVGEPLIVAPALIPSLVEQLARFTVKLQNDGAVVAEGSGKNCLRSPALCLGELAAATARPVAAEPLVAGELVSSGTLTESQPIAPGQVWRASVSGLPLSDVSLRVLG